MYNIAVCDDEKKDRENLEMQIRKYLAGKDEKYLIKAYESGEQLLADDITHDIVFLDIIMNEKDGIQVGAELKKRSLNVMIIYTTNLNEKITVALNQIHSFGYLVKPVEEKDLFQIMSDAMNHIKCNINVNANSEVFISECNTPIKFPVMDIFYFEYRNRRVKIVSQKGTHICKDKINNIAQKMKPYGFAMSHQSFVVNLYHVDKISNQILIMKNGDKVYLAQKRASALRKQLMQIAKESINRGGSKR